MTKSNPNVFILNDTVIGVNKNEGTIIDLSVTQVSNTGNKKLPGFSIDYSKTIIEQMWQIIDALDVDFTDNNEMSDLFFGFSDFIYNYLKSEGIRQEYEMCFSRYIITKFGPIRYFINGNCDRMVIVKPCATETIWFAGNHYIMDLDINTYISHAVLFTNTLDIKDEEENMKMASAIEQMLHDVCKRAKAFKETSS